MGASVAALKHLSKLTHLWGAGGPETREGLHWPQGGGQGEGHPALPGHSQAMAAHGGSGEGTALWPLFLNSELTLALASPGLQQGRRGRSSQGSPSCCCVPWPQWGVMSNVWPCFPNEANKQTNKQTKFKIALNFHWKWPLLRASAQTNPSGGRRGAAEGKGRGRLPGSVCAPCAAGSCERGRGGSRGRQHGPRDLLSFQQGVQILRLYVRVFVPLRV